MRKRLRQFAAHGQTWTINQLGGAQNLVLILAIPPGPVAAVGGAGAASANPMPGADGLGLGGGSAVQPAQTDLDALQAAITQLQAMSLDSKNASRPDKSKKKKKNKSSKKKNPGALTAHFLAGVYARLSKGTITRTSQLRDVSVAQRAHQYAGLTEVRDIKEILTLAEILDAVNRREVATALDVLCQRILAIQAAKQKGGPGKRRSRSNW